MMPQKVISKIDRSLAKDLSHTESAFKRDLNKEYKGVRPEKVDKLKTDGWAVEREQEGADLIIVSKLKTKPAPLAKKGK